MIITTNVCKLKVVFQVNYCSSADIAYMQRNTITSTRQLTTRCLDGSACNAPATQANVALPHHSITADINNHPHFSTVPKQWTPPDANNGLGHIQQREAGGQLSQLLVDGASAVQCRTSIAQASLARIRRPGTTHCKTWSAMVEQVEQAAHLRYLSTKYWSTRLAFNDRPMRTGGVQCASCWYVLHWHRFLLRRWPVSRISTCVV